MKILIDTSVVIDYIRAGIGNLPDLLLMAKNKQAVIYVPSVVILELWRGVSMDNLKNEKSMERLLGGMQLIDLTKALAKKAGELMRRELIADFSDSIIAATAIYLDASLATRNKKHFEKVKDIHFFRN